MSTGLPPDSVFGLDWTGLEYMCTFATSSLDLCVFHSLSLVLMVQSKNE